MGILNDMYHGKSGFFGEERITNPDYIRCIGKLAALEEDILKQYPDIESQLEQLKIFGNSGGQNSAVKVVMKQVHERKT